MEPVRDRFSPTTAAFSGDLQARLELVRDRVETEAEHLDQVAAVAASYAVPLPSLLKLVR